MALVEDDEEVLREVVDQRVRLRAGLAALDVAGVVLDPIAEADLAHHLEVVFGTHPQSLGLEQLVLAREHLKPVAELGLDLDDGPLHVLARSHVVGARVDGDVVELAEDLAGQRIEPDDAVDLVAEQLDADRVLLVGREDLDRVAARPELAPHEVHVVALVLDVDQLLKDEVAIGRATAGEVDDLIEVLLGRAQAEDRRNARHDQHVLALKQSARRRVAQALDLVVDRAVLLYIGVGAGDVGLGLVIVVVADEVLDRVVREELLELVAELGRQGLVRGDDERGLLDPLDRPGGRRRLPGPGGPEQGQEAASRHDRFGERVDGRRLVSGGLEIGHDLERGHRKESRRTVRQVHPDEIFRFGGENRGSIWKIWRSEPRSRKNLRSRVLAERSGGITQRRVSALYPRHSGKDRRRRSYGRGWMKHLSVRTGPAPAFRYAVAATFAVIVAPALSIYAALYLLEPDPPAMATTLASLAVACLASTIGTALWMRRPESAETSFGELMVWSWVRRRRADRALAEGAGVLHARPGTTMSRERQLKALHDVAAALEAKDPYTLGHSKRVARQSYRTAVAMGMTVTDLEDLRLAAELHDVGKIQVPDRIIRKETALSIEEQLTMQSHAVVGAGMVAVLGNNVADAIRHHHERWDGLGYPDGLSGEDIPLLARLIAVADTYDAITSTRPYRVKSDRRAAVQVLRAESGRQLDPRVVEAFITQLSAAVPALGALGSLAPNLRHFFGEATLATKRFGIASLSGGVAAAGATMAIGGATLAPPATIEHTRQAPVAAVAESGDSGIEDRVAGVRFERQPTTQNLAAKVSSPKNRSTDRILAPVSDDRSRTDGKRGGGDVDVSQQSGGATNNGNGSHGHGSNTPDRNEPSSIVVEDEGKNEDEEPGLPDEEGDEDDGTGDGDDSGTSNQSSASSNKDEDKDKSDPDKTKDDNPDDNDNGSGNDEDNDKNEDQPDEGKSDPDKTKDDNPDDNDNGSGNDKDKKQG